jgi:hypothetical protein
MKSILLKYVWKVLHNNELFIILESHFILKFRRPQSQAWCHTPALRRFDASLSYMERWRPVWAT